MEKKLEDINGIGKTIADKLKESGVDTAEKLEASNAKDLIKLKIKGIGKVTATRYINNAKKFLKGPKPSSTPLNDLKVGESIAFESLSGKIYTIKNSYGIYSCTCLGWTFQSNAPDKRTCKHLRAFRGDEAEKARVGSLKTVRRKGTTGTSKRKKSQFPVMLAQKWDSSIDPTGWYISEKLDGVRAYWNGSGFYSRQGNKFSAPNWFTQGLSSFPLDGELFIDRKQFQLTVSIVRSMDKGDSWKLLKYNVFDAPKETGRFEERLNKAKEWFKKNPSEYVNLLEQIKCKNYEHLQEEFDKIVSLGGEGLILRAPNSLYVDSRSDKMLKFKPFNDAECIVTGYTKGTGKYINSTGALKVELPNGTKFKLGTGLSDKQREKPPKIGSTVTFRYQELTNDGIPRFPVFLRVRRDVKWDDLVAGKDQKPKSKVVKKKGMTQNEKNSINQGKTYRYELSDDKSNKFWEITLKKLSYEIRYGRIGTNGRTISKSWLNESEA